MLRSLQDLDQYTIAAAEVADRAQSAAVGAHIGG